MSQYKYNGIHQNSAAILSYQDNATSAIFFLVGRHTGSLMFPGGQVDIEDSYGRTHEQTLAHAAKRELHEETGINLKQFHHTFNLVNTQYFPASANGRYPEKHVHFYHAHLGRLNHDQIKHIQDTIKNSSKDDLQEVQFIAFNAINTVQTRDKTKHTVVCADGRKHGINPGNYLEMTKMHQLILSQPQVDSKISSTKPRREPTRPVSTIHLINTSTPKTAKVQIKTQPSLWFVMRSFFDYLLSILRDFFTLRWLFQSNTVKVSKHSMFENQSRHASRDHGPMLSPNSLTA